MDGGKVPSKDEQKMYEMTLSEQIDASDNHTKV